MKKGLPSILARLLKTASFPVLFLAAFLAGAADTGTTSKIPPAVIMGVSTAEDGRTLIIRYELSGRTHEQRVGFTNNITDFRYCRWLGGRGIAVAVSTGSDEFYYATVYLVGRDVAPAPAKVPAPAGTSRLLGIANTGGDSIVVTAVQHRRESPGRLTGWMFIDNCPPIPAAGLLIPFDLSGERADKVK